MSQANWSPTTGLNLSKRLPTQKDPHPRPSPMASLATWPSHPTDDQSRVDPSCQPNAMTFGSLQFDREVLRPLSPFQGHPNVHLTQSQRLGNSMGAVWVPNPKLSPERRVTYSHDLSRPDWRAKDDYHSMLDWRSSRVITDNCVAVDFNRACDAARSLNGLSHQTDPLLWCRDGVNPAPLPAGEHKSLRQLLVDSDEEQVTPGCSGASITQTQLNSNARELYKSDNNTAKLDKLDEPDNSQVHTGLHSPIMPTPASSLPERTTNGRASKCTCARKSRARRTPGTVLHRRIGTLEEYQSTDLEINTTPLTKSPHRHCFPPPQTSLVTAGNQPGEDLLQVDEISSPTGSNSQPNASSPAPATGRFRWPKQPGQLDVLWLSFLASTSPFKVAKEIPKKFCQCAEILTMLKKWLSKVEAKSRSDSGTQEDDSELRKAIKALAIQEEELKTITKAEKAVKERAAIALAKANELCDARAFRTQSVSPQNRTDPDDNGEDDLEANEAGKHGPTSLWALRDGLLNKLSGNESSSTHMINVTLKSSEAAEKANELTRMALE
ncbi:hypothetical protein DFH28DRAFT_921935 [Melampsora americana]|nr:hypothetical protein DFH28DRAFT_921935 [Melampsora americana]